MGVNDRGLANALKMGQGRSHGPGPFQENARSELARAAQSSPMSSGIIDPGAVFGCWSPLQRKQTDPLIGIPAFV